MIYMKIAICDDERIFTDIFREKLEMTAEKCGIECTVSAFLNGAEMISMRIPPRPHSALRQLQTPTPTATATGKTS